MHYTKNNRKHFRRTLLAFLYIPICLSLSGTTYYISPNGRDSNPGSLSQPFFTLNKAWTVISAGDIVYLRGGTYSFPTSQELTGVNGTAANPIKIWAYPGETPVITKAAGWTYYNSEGIHFEGNYFHWKGIEIRGFTQLDDNIIVGFRTIYSSHNIFELLNCHGNSRGFELTDGCNDNLILNCDFHHNYDPLSTDSYGNADGFAANPDLGSTNTIRGCRSWNNSDDGYDIFRCDGMIIIDDCWSWMNGYKEDGTTKGGDGYGFKLGITNTNRSSSHLRTVTNCLAFHNREGGFGLNEAKCICWLFNNTAYHNNDGTGYYLGFWFDGEDGIVHRLKNNIAYANQNTRGLDANWTAESTQDHNSWDGTVTVTNADFETVSSTGVDGQRQSDGSLPDLNFLKLAKGSDLIDAGIDLGLPYEGIAPDLGAFESHTDSPPLIPRFISAAVENSSPSLLEMTYNLTLADIVPSLSAFNVLVNSIVRPVSSAEVSGAKVRLTLASPVKFGDTITTSYTKTRSNPLQTDNGGTAESIYGKPVTNNCNNVSINGDPPVVVINSAKTIYEGFVSEIDASSTYDPNNDPLIINWIVPYDVPVSDVKSLKTQFLAPMVDNSKSIDFHLTVSDGKTILSNDVPVTVLPYKPELISVRITKIEASDFQSPDYVKNILDNDTETKWSSNGDNKWLLLKFAGPFKISHLEIAFLHGQHFESYFDIYASQDSIKWEPILTWVSSCNFSGDRQVFTFPASNTDTEYSYLKYIGHGNSLNNWNYISEFKVFGSPGKNYGSDATKKRNVIIYPNPASSILNISLEESTLKSDMVRILDLSGKIVFEEILNPVTRSIQIPLSLKSGIYYVDLNLGKLILFTQKIIINN